MLRCWRICSWQAAANAGWTRRRVTQRRDASSPRSTEAPCIRHPATPTATTAAAPSTNSFSIIVADNGTPSLTATQTFNVVIYLPAPIGLQMFGNQMVLSWPRGTLQQADEVTGPYSDMPQSSPYFVTPNTARKFYRIRF